VQWRVRYWTATLETNKDGRHHAHLMLQFFGERDTTVQPFFFEGLRPNAQANDYFGEGWCSKPGRYQVSLDRGHFYVYANKKGTVVDDGSALCVAGNYTPAWTDGASTYVVKAWVHERVQHRTAQHTQTKPGQTNAHKASQDKQTQSRTKAPDRTRAKARATATATAERKPSKQSQS